MSPRDDTRRTQAERRSASRTALLGAAAIGFAQQGYARLSLEKVAADAGYTRGALYHQFASKEDLALAVVQWIEQSWDADVGQRSRDEPDPLPALLVMARGTVVYCRNEAARALVNLRVEFTGAEHAIGRALIAFRERLVARTADLVERSRADGTVPPGPPSEPTARAFVSVVDAIATQLAGRTDTDVEFAERAARGVLGIESAERPS